MTTPSPPLEALRDLLRAHAIRPGCQAGLVARCICVPCATERAESALAQPAESAEAKCEECSGRGWIDASYQVDNFGRTLPAWERCDALHPESAEAGAAPAERTALIAAHNAIEGLLAWDAKRNFPVPYRVRDPLREVLGAERSTLAAKNGLALAEKREGASKP